MKTHLLPACKVSCLVLNEKSKVITPPNNIELGWTVKPCTSIQALFCTASCLWQITSGLDWGIDHCAISKAWLHVSLLPYLSCSMELQLMPLRPPVLHASAKRSMVRWSSSELIHPLWLTFIQSTPDTTKIGLAGMKKGQGQVIPCTAPAKIMGMRRS